MKLSARRLLQVLIATSIVSTSLDAGLVETVAPQLGRAVAPVSWVDETGRAHRLPEFTGYPVILLPVYTRCRTACVTNLSRLKAALAETAADPTQFRVLLFSFDDTDTPAVLASYRARENVPLSWSIGSASKTEIATLLDSIGYQVGQAGKEFTHPNMLVFLDRKLHIAKWIYGDNYSGREIDAALRVAAGESDWVGRHSDVLYALLLFALILSAVALSFHLMKLVASRRARRDQAGHLSKAPAAGPRL